MSVRRAGREGHRGLPSLAIGRPVGTVMLTSVVVVLGVFFLRGLPLDLLPTIVYPQLRVRVNNRGVEPQVLEETIAKRLEAALATTENLTEHADGDPRRAGGREPHVLLRHRRGLRPAGRVEEPGARPGRAPRRGGSARASTSSTPTRARCTRWRSAPTCATWCRSGSGWSTGCKPQLLTIEGVASIDISGGLVREIEVVLDQERLRSYGLTVSQVIEAVRSANQDVAAGRVASSTREVVGKTAGKFRTVDDVAAVLLTVPGGARVPLSEIASVRDTHQEQRLWARLDGVPAVKVSVRKQPNANTVSVAEGVDRQLAAAEGVGSFTPGDIQLRDHQQPGGLHPQVGAVRGERRAHGRRSWR